ncbi:hypothetical protein J4727_04805 [Providencia rettgeri]|uniref:Uncharacterized protein n=1 Tax=Providencia rettgeri TaxID=587 RepID=A0A939NBV3_PRORE|nr:hypothetical protein [Providencia rettgeri]
MQYRSIFHAGALSQSDNLYIQKVAAKVNFDELKDIQLNNIPNIIEKWSLYHLNTMKEFITLTLLII